ncbi:MAG: hypothetical protein ABFS35_01870 [Bacteroidota bacterium]
MKKLSFILTIVVAVFFASCQKDSAEIMDNNILPETFSVEIPQSLSSSTLKLLKNGEEDGLNGNIIYEHLRVFIHVGDEAAKIVEEVIIAIRLYGLSEPMSFSYEGDDDGRTKNVVIIADSEYEGTLWNYQMTVTDADSEGNDDGGVGMQIFWNTGTIMGIAIMKPFNIDRNTEALFAQAMFRIDYSEAGENAYEQEMTVYISGITLPDASLEPYAMETLKMTAGRNGNVVEVFGNSNHPNATLFTVSTGFNWAFVAAGQLETDLGVAEVGLPPSDLNSNDREVILGRYSIKNVFTNEIIDTYPGIDPALLGLYLQNTDAPGYFDANGFVQGGIAPSTDYIPFSAAIENLVPFSPLAISNLSLEFKANASVK